jgi:hypothetical protein
VEQLKDALLCGRLMALPTNIRLGSDKHCSLLRTFVKYERKKFYNIVSSVNHSSRTVMLAFYSIGIMLWSYITHLAV